MTREPVDTKARRYLVEGRLTVTQLDSLSIEASCRGGGAVYELGHNGAEWWCSCPARGRCAHLVALQAVTVRAGGVDDDPEPEVDPEPVVTRPTSSGAAVDDEDDVEPAGQPVSLRNSAVKGGVARCGTLRATLRFPLHSSLRCAIVHSTSNRPRDAQAPGAVTPGGQVLMHVESNPVDRSAESDERVEPPVIRRLRELLEAELRAGESADRDKAADAAPGEVVSSA